MNKTISLVSFILLLVSCNHINDRGRFTDIRDDNKYKWVRIGDQVWMAENLYYITDSGSFTYNNDEKLQGIYGRLYQHKVARIVCPSGWRLPSEKDWEELRNHYYRQGKALKIFSFYGKRPYLRVRSGFNAVPGGYGDGLKFNAIENDGYYWSSTINANGTIKICHITFYFWGGDELSLFDYVPESKSGYSVRCIKD